MKILDTGYKVATILHILAFVLLFSILRLLLSEIENSGLLTVCIIICLLPFISFVILMVNRHRVYMDRHEHKYDLVLQYSNDLNTPTRSFVQEYTSFCHSYGIVDPSEFGRACIEAGMHKYIISLRAHPEERVPDYMIDRDLRLVVEGSNLMKYRGKEAEIEYLAEDDIFCGTVLGEYGLLHFTGKSVSELHANFQIVVDHYHAYWARIQDELSSP